MHQYSFPKYWSRTVLTKQKIKKTTSFTPWRERIKPIIDYSKKLQNDGNIK